eukprot:TRINITY_DN99594_c0_g1_i1.p1 TRINITY_DN99594_c0_g1~~TRINITY_DN99594_c0_g1_i1.p1  ORF type:complete len:133 (+),score=18.45 TRINITY_DN99594_c0_g1_i1:31-399(+)
MPTPKRVSLVVFRSPKSGPQRRSSQFTKRLSWKDDDTVVEYSKLNLSATIEQKLTNSRVAEYLEELHSAMPPTPPREMCGTLAYNSKRPHELPMEDPYVRLSSVFQQADRYLPTPPGKKRRA